MSGVTDAVLYVIVSSNQQPWLECVMSAIMDHMRAAVSFVEVLGCQMPTTVKNVPV